MSSHSASLSLSRETLSGVQHAGDRSAGEAASSKETSKPDRRSTEALGNLANLSNLRPARETSPPPRLNVQQYLEIRHERPKNLVIGCGTTPQQVTMGTMAGTACSLGSDHHNDFTVDLSNDAGANLTLDFARYKDSELHEHGNGQFDTVAFEYLNRGPRNRFSEAEIDRFIEGADALLNKSGKITFYNGDRNYRAQARTAMEARGYTVTDKVDPPTLENPQGHIYCEGVKNTSKWSLSGWLKG
jgi:hypothetical protein